MTTILGRRSRKTGAGGSFRTRGPSRKNVMGAIVDEVRTFATGEQQDEVTVLVVKCNEE